MVARALVVDIPKDSLYGIGLRTVAGQPQQLHSRMSIQPPLDNPRLVDPVSICHHVDPANLRRRTFLLNQLQQLQKQKIDLPLSDDVQQLSCRSIQSRRQIPLLILARGHDFHLRAPRHPLAASASAAD